MSDQLFCPIRKTWVKSLPEELVRQTLIQRMNQQLGYPLSGFALEKNLEGFSSCPASLPKRRADLIFFAKNIYPSHALYPFLLIECKAVKLTPKVIRQVIGYNFHLQACFIAVANQEETRLGWYDKQQKEFRFIPALLSYSDLLSQWARLNAPRPLA